MDGYVSFHPGEGRLFGLYRSQTVRLRLPRRFESRVRFGSTPFVGLRLALGAALATFCACFFFFFVHVRTDVEPDVGPGTGTRKVHGTERRKKV